MLDFICMGSTELFGTGEAKKFKIEICLQRDSNPRNATPDHDKQISALDRSAMLVRYQVEYL